MNTAASLSSGQAQRKWNDWLTKTWFKVHGTQILLQKHYVTLAAYWEIFKTVICLLNQVWGKNKLRQSSGNCTSEWKLGLANFICLGMDPSGVVIRLDAATASASKVLGWDVTLDAGSGYLLPVVKRCFDVVLCQNLSDVCVSFCVACFSCCQNGTKHVISSSWPSLRLFSQELQWGQAVSRSLWLHY